MARAILRAWVLSEFGDDTHRHTDGEARELRRHVRASGEKKVAASRLIHDDEWAHRRALDPCLRFADSSPGTSAFPDKLRVRRVEHNEGLRQLRTSSSPSCTDA
jgi:hypothetical protein